MHGLRYTAIKITIIIPLSIMHGLRYTAIKITIMIPSPKKIKFSDYLHYKSAIIFSNTKLTIFKHCFLWFWLDDHWCYLSTDPETECIWQDTSTHSLMFSPPPPPPPPLNLRWPCATEGMLKSQNYLFLLPNLLHTHTHTQSNSTYTLASKFPVSSIEDNVSAFPFSTCQQSDCLTDCLSELTDWWKNRLMNWLDDYDFD